MKNDLTSAGWIALSEYLNWGFSAFEVWKLNGELEEVKRERSLKRMGKKKK